MKGKGAAGRTVGGFNVIVSGTKIGYDPSRWPDYCHGVYVNCDGKKEIRLQLLFWNNFKSDCSSRHHHEDGRGVSLQQMTS